MFDLISPQAQPRSPTLLTAIGKTSISSGWRETFRLKCDKYEYSIEYAEKRI